MTAHQKTLPFARPISLLARSLFWKIRMVSGTVSDFNRCGGAQSKLCEGARYFQSLEEWPTPPFTTRI
jgi:hypothetical protein